MSRPAHWTRRTRTLVEPWRLDAPPIAKKFSAPGQSLAWHHAQRRRCLEQFRSHHTLFLSNFKQSIKITPQRGADSEQTSPLISLVWTPKYTRSSSSVLAASKYHRVTGNLRSTYSDNARKAVSNLSDMRSAGTMHKAVIAFGSNIGNRVTHIENALAAMRSRGLRILNISRLYETKAMYYEDQEAFLNGVVLVETDLEPLALLDVLQTIELEEGRKRDIEKGPRTLDLDIILYGFDEVNHERLKIPHPLMMEREFVLRPLTDILPTHDLRDSGARSEDASQSDLVSVLSALERIKDPQVPMYPVTYLTSNRNLINATSQRRSTGIMSILNITPDSFSDGGQLTLDNLENIVSTAQSHIHSGATILDIGGQSTRPNATLVSAEEELSRILPVLHAIRAIPQIRRGEVAVSVDTFYSSVARVCSEEGLIDIVNDISAGQLDPKKSMLSTVALCQKTIVLMHMRGTPQTMTSKVFTDYGPGGVVAGVATELAQRVNEALEAGIPPWRIILDPGVGFAKNMAQNLELIRRGAYGISLEAPDVLHGYPWLFGLSRKGFIGKITGEREPSERVWGTAAGVTASVAGGADIVRVHDTAEMTKVVKMADAMYRGILPDSEIKQS